MEKTIELAGRKFSFKLSLGAMKKFDNKFKAENVSILTLGDLSNLRIDHMIHLMFYGIEAGYKFAGEKCPIKIEWIENNVGMEELSEFSKAFNMGEDTKSNEESNEKKS